MKTVAAIAAAVVAFLAGAGSAGATIISPPDTWHDYPAWARQANAPLPPQTITVTYGTISRDCGESPFGGTIVACAVAGNSTMPIRRRAPRPTFWHELGHFFDFAYMDETWRRTFAAIVGRPGGSWDDPAGHGLREPFAETWAFCAATVRRQNARETVWGNRGSWLFISVSEARAICRLLPVIQTEANA